MPRQRPHRSKQDYGTPAAFLREVELRWGNLTLDLACTQTNRVAPVGLDGDSLGSHWPTHDVRLWLNPPFTRIGDWAAKCAEWVLGATGGSRLFLLTPASVGTEWFADHVHGKAMVYGLRPRLTFVGCKDPYPKDLILSVYGDGPGFGLWRWR